MSEVILDQAFNDFVISLLPLYTDPFVTIRIGSSSRKYKLSKALLCKQSQYFKATFEGGFREGEEQSTTLKEIDGVVSTRGFEVLIQWLYLGRVVLGDLTPTDSISAAIEFVRFADMCGVTGMESIMAEHIKATILANPAPPSSDLNSNTYCLESSHIVSAANLPDGHPVRRVLAAAVAGAFLRDDNHKFSNEVKENVGFVSDLLEAIRETLKTLEAVGFRVAIKDPLSGKRWYLGK